jgi:hypothetical protein
MKVLLFGELGPGSLGRSFEPGLAEAVTVLATDPYPSRRAERAKASHAWTHMTRRLRDHAQISRTGTTLVEAVEQLEPDIVLIVKGRGVDADSIRNVRRLGVPVALFYPDNPGWGISDTRGVLARLEACTLMVIWSERLAMQLESRGIRARVLPFGYDDRWWIPTPPSGDRHGIAFLGTWSPRRERFLASLDGLPLTVCGTGWERATVPACSPIREKDAGALLARSLIGVNLLHPQCAGAHNMRTREIAAVGALELTDPGTDGTPLRPPQSCVWFETPQELRGLAEHYIARPDEAAAIAGNAQTLTRDDTYVERGRTLARWLTELV